MVGIAKGTTMTTKHTPNVWRIAIGGDGYHILTNDNDGIAREICMVPNREHAEDIVACVNACEGINPEAVPDLLAACKAADDEFKRIDSFIGDFTGYVEDEPWWAVQDAIAKAEPSE
jgi:hypothetical protein